MTGFEEAKREYWNERLSQHWGPEGVGSVPFGRSFNVWRYRVRRRVFRRLVRRLALQSGVLSVLDVGCGTGFYLEQWREFGVASTAGLDISDWVVTQLARSHPNATFYRGNIGASGLSLPSQAFDVITAMDVLVHLVDDASYLQAIENLFRSLKPGGCLIHSDAFFHGPDKLHENYWRGRSLATVIAVMEATGFEVVARVPLSVLMSAPTDTRHRRWNERVWNLVLSPVRRWHWIGFFFGALLYPIELALVFTLKESPAIEVMICRKRI